MHNDFLLFHTEALAEVFAFVGSTVSFRGSEIQAVVNAVELGNDLKEGGLWEDLQTTVIFQKCDLDTPPVTGEKITIDGKSIRIIKVDADEVSYEVKCETATR